MEKLCSLKHIVPGAIVELPSKYQKEKGELAVVLGPQYVNKTSDMVLVTYLRQDDKTVAAPAEPDSENLTLIEDSKFKQHRASAFAANKIGLPDLPVSSGCDPEVFVLHEDGSLFPAWEFMPDEEAARQIAKEWMTAEWNQSDTIYKGAVWQNPAASYNPQRCPAYWDGAQAEFAPYAKNCLEALHYGTREGLKTVLAAARAKDPKAKLTLRNVVELPESTLKSADDKFIQFRCSQSYNIYGDPGDGVPNARNYKYRCAGGHIHIGYTRRFTASAIEQIVRSLDGILGVAGVSLAAGIDNPERRNTYGRAGEFRLPNHGLEYRVLSNFWLCHPAIAMLVFELARAATRMGESGLYNLCWDAGEQEIRDVINNCDVQGARNILTRNLPVLKAMLRGIWGQFASSEQLRMRKAAIHTIMNGIGAAVPEPMDIEKNWLLNSEFKWYCRSEGVEWISLSKSIKC